MVCHDLIEHSAQPLIDRHSRSDRARRDHKRGEARDHLPRLEQIKLTDDSEEPVLVTGRDRTHEPDSIRDAGAHAALRRNPVFVIESVP